MYYYSLGGRIIIVLTDIYIIFAYVIIVYQNINVGEITYKVPLIICIIPIFFIIVCGIICFINIKNLENDYLISIRNNKCSDLVSRKIKVIYYPLISKFNYTDMRIKNINTNIWNDYFISILFVIEIMIISCILVL